MLYTINLDNFTSKLTSLFISKQLHKQFEFAKKRIKRKYV